ncbi:MAG: hypothetical protein ACJ76F_13405 [Bacteroidia bacterium]
MKVINKDYKTAPVPLDFVHKTTMYAGEARPVYSSCHDGVCFELDITLNAEHLGTISCGENMKWTMRNISDQTLIDKIGEEIALWYE